MYGLSSTVRCARGRVVVARVASQVTPEAGLLRDQRAGEGRLPALLEDRALHALQATVGLGPAGVDEAVLGAELGDGAPAGLVAR